MKKKNCTIVESYYGETFSPDEDMRYEKYRIMNKLIYANYRFRLDRPICKLNPIDIEIAMGARFEVAHMIDYEGVDVNLPNELGITPLMTAICFRDYEIVKMLIEKGADVNAIYKKENFSPLIFACNTKKDKIIELLLQNGADISIKDRKGYDPLQHIVSEGSNKNILSNYALGFGELHYPFKNEYDFPNKPTKENVLKSIDLLVDAGIDINYVNTENNVCVNALSIALESFQNNDYIIKKLIEKGALKTAYEINPSFIYAYQISLEFVGEDIKARDLSELPRTALEYLYYLRYLIRIKKNGIQVSYQEDDNFKRSKTLKKERKK